MTKTEHRDFFRDILSESNILLAPMAGVTDAAYRQICHKKGFRTMFTEMVSAKGMVYGNENTLYLTKLFPSETNTALQLFGCEAKYMARAIEEYVNKSDFAFLDINMGCPVRKIVGNGEGSALLRNPQKLYDLATALVKVSEKPVSAKIRLGIDGKINASENAAALEEAGIGMITVHGRTREMFYSGKADYAQIAKVVGAVKIPVIANGDICDYESYKRALEETGAVGVMIGRAAMGNPFIISQITSQIAGEDYIQISAAEKLRTALEHFELLNEYKGEAIACNEFRKHLCYYTKGMPGGAAVRGKVSSLSTAEQFRDYINKLIGEFSEQ
ncbi:MAG: tRNA dihydrouridine synthase DusB [Eubacteriaceae bacterium]|nr:tRNA dihydrouridine synthase DusB [Eubacteriaceae bacterium]